MTTVVEHTSFRYSWELIRHRYLLDLESEIDIQQVEVSPSKEGRLLPPPYGRTAFFEVEIDQIQKNGKTVSSFRNICPVEVEKNPAGNPFRRVLGKGGLRVLKRFQSADEGSEIRWLYTDDFFLISLSSGDRHDLEMLIALIIGKLDTIARSVQSGKRVSSEFENQQKYRADMSSMFASGVDGAFREVPVYLQHGEMTGRDIDVSAALRSVEFRDLNAIVASEEAVVAVTPPEGENPPRAVAPDEHSAEYRPEEDGAATAPAPGMASPDIFPVTSPWEPPKFSLPEEIASEPVPAAEEPAPETETPGMSGAGSITRAEDLAEETGAGDTGAEPVPAAEEPALETETPGMSSAGSITGAEDLPEDAGTGDTGAEPVSAGGEAVPLTETPGTSGAGSIPGTADLTEEERADESGTAQVPAAEEAIPEAKTSGMIVTGSPAPAGDLPEEKDAGAAMTEPVPAVDISAISGKKRPVIEPIPADDDLPATALPEEDLRVAEPVPAAIRRPAPAPEPARADSPVVTFFPASRLCRGCGATIPGTAKFCNTCGTSVAGSGSPAAKPAAARTCHRCGTGLSGTAKFCDNCGTAAADPAPAGVAENPAETPTCLSCGTELSGTAKFCRQCGTAVPSGRPSGEKQQ